MDIVAESLSAKTLKSREVLVNGQDIMEYIKSKLSTAVEFSGVYDDIDNIPLSAQFNGSIVIVDSKEYIYSDKSEPNHWQEIGDETAIGQLSSDLVGEASDLSSASTINAAKNYAKDLVDSLDVVDAPVQNQFVVAVSQKDGVISVERAQLTIPEGLSSYADTVANLSNDGYALTADLSEVSAQVDEKIENKYYQLIYPQSFNTDFGKLSAADMTANMISIVPETLFINSDSDLSDVSFKNASIASITLSAADKEPIEITSMSIVASTNPDSSITADYIGGETNQQTFSTTGSTKYTFSTPVPLNADTVYFFFKQNGVILSSIKTRFVLEAGTATDPIGPTLDSYHPYFVCELAGKNFDVLRRILAHLEA